MTELKRSDFGKICRTCLLEKEDMEPIFKTDIPKMLMSFTNIKVEPEDELPSAFCTSCITSIHLCYQFKVQTEINQEILQMCLVKSEENIEIKPELDFGWDNNQSDTEEEEEEPKVKKRKHNDRQISDSCKYCNKKFVDRYVLKRHIENMHTKIREKETCRICNRQVVCMKPHIQRKHNGEFKYKCHQGDCDEKFLYKSDMMDHIVRTGHKDDTSQKHKFLCTNCGKILHSRKAYGYHLLLHSGERPFQCTFCVKKFRSHNYLKIHERTHTDERPYPCTYCDRAFRDSGTLKGHIRTHTGEKPFVCGVCGRGFAQRIAMKTHMKIHGTPLLHL